MNYDECHHCGDTDAEFYASYPSKCKKCVVKRTKAWADKNPEKVRQYSRLAKHGITQEEYDALLVLQDGRCAICGTDAPGGTGTWHIDHDHSCCGPKQKRFCGKCVRGLLCVSCNWGLGHFKDDPKVLLEAADYLIQRGCGSN
jgi:hypothetical protein